MLRHAFEQFASTGGFDEQKVAVAAMLLLSANQIGDVNDADEALEHVCPTAWVPVSDRSRSRSAAP